MGQSNQTVVDPEFDVQTMLYNALTQTKLIATGNSHSWLDALLSALPPLIHNQPNKLLQQQQVKTKGNRSVAECARKEHHGTHNSGRYWAGL